MSKKTIGACVLIISALTSCENATTKTTGSKQEPPLADIMNIETPQHGISKKLRCDFTNPDTSVCGIKLRDAASTTAIIDSNLIDSLGQYHFYSTFERETLTLVQYPGDVKNQISVFKVKYGDKASYGYRQLPLNGFVTEKGVRLGLTKKQLVEKLGGCYATLDSTKRTIELSYRIEQPKDSKTKLLATNDIPVYYASYKLCDDKLIALEFGFEYP